MIIGFDDIAFSDPVLKHIKSSIVTPTRKLVSPHSICNYANELPLAE